MSDEPSPFEENNPFEIHSDEPEPVSKPETEKTIEPKEKIDEDTFLAELEEAEKEDSGDDDGGFFF